MLSDGFGKVEEIRLVVYIIYTWRIVLEVLLQFRRRGSCPNQGSILEVFDDALDVLPQNSCLLHCPLQRQVCLLFLAIPGGVVICLRPQHLDL